MNQRNSIKGSRGGRRAGAGRKPGSLNIRTRAIAEAAAAQGVTPLEVMLSNMRRYWQLALDAEGTAQGEDELAYRRLAQDAATDAAPFVHPRLSAVEIESMLRPPTFEETLKQWRESETQHSDSRGVPPTPVGEPKTAAPSAWLGAKLGHAVVMRGGELE